jgi:hypothetical protein
MKSMYKIFFVIGLVWTLTTVSYGQEKQREIAKHKVTKYTCTMHPEVVRNQPGKCPKCGMTLVKQMEPKEARQDRTKVKNNKGDTTKMNHGHRMHKDSMRRMDKKVLPDFGKMILK